ncbi:hypothetical protein B0A55_01019 [Friedmanniomyces simplex]|uniref:Stc1 domain-containing protein n=1 Tax=Friedmanniomyces simplex TaxID=329884 RepID=A0A4U0Y576_9PEZI|nr:hypothetical protein B0A55_01019 [Friedmanniomyces simplex]
MVAPPCDDRLITYRLLGTPSALGPPCASGPAFPFYPDCREADVPQGPPPAVDFHNPGPDNVCNACWTAADPMLSRRERRRLRRPVVRRGTAPGEPKYAQDPRGVMALLCWYCERDETELYKRRRATGAVPAPANFRGWRNTCICQRARIRFPVGGAEYCVRCRRYELSNIRAEADAERNERGVFARDATGNPVTGAPGLQAWRVANGRPIACRCGRNTVEATVHPKVMQCLCCNGVRIDDGQVKIQRRTLVAIAARAALPAGDKHALPALPMAAFVRPARMLALPAVAVSNSKR